MYMLQIKDTLVSLDLIEQFFCCDLDACKGACCIEGDAGAPVTPEEIAHLEEVLEEIRPELDPEALAVIDAQGVAYTDEEGDLVTSIVRGKDCVFTCYDAAGCCFCATERAHRQGRTKWCKPISCALYPIRVKQFKGGLVGLNYHRWSVCRPAVQKGRELGLPVYKFLREPLIRRFGAEWYAELEAVAHEALGEAEVGAAD